MLVVPADEAGTTGYLELVWISEAGEIVGSEILNDGPQSRYTVFQPVIFPDSFDLSSRAYECGSQFETDGISVKVYSGRVTATSVFTVALVSLTNSGANWESIVEMSANPVVISAQPYSTVILRSMSVPSDCSSGSSGLILNVAVGSQVQEFGYYNVWNPTVSGFSMIYSFGDFEPTIGDGTSMMVESFEAVPVTVAEGQVSPPIIIVLTPEDDSFYGSDDTTELYILGCAPPYSPSDYSTFGWFTWMLRSNATDFEYDTMVFPTGMYAYNTYYYPFQATLDNLEDFVSDGTYAMYVINSPQNSYNNTISVKDGDKDPFEIVDNDANNGDLKRGESTTFSVTTTGLNGSNTIEYAYLKDDGKTPCDDSSTGTFQYSGETTQWDTQIPDSCDKDSFTLKLWVTPCGMGDDESYQSTKSYQLKKSSGGGGSGGLSVGAIIGIVCASVLIVGLAAWWLLMRKSDPSSGGYSSMD